MYADVAVTRSAGSLDEAPESVDTSFADIASETRTPAPDPGSARALYSRFRRRRLPFDAKSADESSAGDPVTYTAEGGSEVTVTNVANILATTGAEKKDDTVPLRPPEK